MKKYLFVIAIIFLICIGYVFYAINHYDIYQKVGVKLGIQNLSLSHLNFTKNYLPSLHLSTEKIVINFTKKGEPQITSSDLDDNSQSHIVMQNVKIYFSLWSILILDPQINKIEIEKLSHKLDDEALLYMTLLQHDKMITYMINNYLSDLMLVKSLSIDQYTVISSSNHNTMLQIRDVLLESDNHQLTLHGEINANSDAPIVQRNTTQLSNISGKYEVIFAELDGEILFKLKVKNKDFDLVLDETYQNTLSLSSSTDTLLNNGKCTLHVFNVSQYIMQIFDKFSIISIDALDDHAVELYFTFAPTEQDFFALSDFVIRSDLFNSNGEIKLARDIENVKSSMILTTDNIPLDQQNNLQDVDIKIDWYKNTIYFQSISGNIVKQSRGVGQYNEQGKFTLNGIIVDSVLNPQFSGNISLTHKDLNVITKLLFDEQYKAQAPINCSLSTNLEFNTIGVAVNNLAITTNDTKITGNISKKFIGDILRIDSEMKFTLLDIDRFNVPLLPNLYSAMSSVLENTKNNDFLNKFYSLGSIDTIAHHSLVFDKIIVNGASYNKVKFDLALSSHDILIKDYFISFDDQWVNGDIAINLSGLKPQFTFTVHGGSIKSDNISPNKMRNWSQDVIKNIDLTKIDILLDIYLHEFKQKAFVCNKLHLKARHDNNLLYITRFNADLLGGALSSSGSVLLYPYKVNFVYAIQSLQLDQLSKLLPQNLFNSSGALSINGVLSTYGQTLDEQLYYLYSEANILAKSVKWNNISIDKFIQQFTFNYKNKKYDQNQLIKDSNISLFSGETIIQKLNSRVKLEKGVLSLPKISMQTHYSAGLASFILNIYDFAVKSSAVFSFFHKNPTLSQYYNTTKLLQFKIINNGNFFSLDRSADIEMLKQVMLSR